MTGARESFKALQSGCFTMPHPARVRGISSAHVQHLELGKQLWTCFARVTVNRSEVLLPKAMNFLSITQSRYEAFYQFVFRLLIHQVELHILQDVIW